MTGGPGAGKTTSFSYLAQKLGDVGIAMLCMPEVATILINSGFDPRRSNGRMDRINFQTHIIEMQLALQEQYKKIARDLPNDRKIILSDRTGLDGKSFMLANDWAELLAEKRWTENYLLLREPGAQPIVKIRTCFIYKAQYFELDTFLKPEKHRGLTLLEIELTEENDKVEIPDWLGPIEEVTGNKKYNNSYLAFN